MSTSRRHAGSRRRPSAHNALREALRTDEKLSKLHVETFLSGSYKRDTAIRPAKIDAPGGGVQRVLHEAKDYVLTSTQFWAEIARLKQVHDTSPAEFPRFALVCRDFNSVTAPLVSKVDRLRGVGASFDDDSVMLAGARREIVEWVAGKGQSESTAQFVIDRVGFVAYGAEHADAAFAGEVEKHLPSVVNRK